MTSRSNNSSRRNMARLIPQKTISMNRISACLTSSTVVICMARIFMEITVINNLVTEKQSSPRVGFAIYIRSYFASEAKAYFY
ncbi:hypothetical protein [Acinetobacter sp. YH16052]|uniref:hypothetical protein n=1 Tax=Acinetobacter sp. YH16052 TaxID=2601191 RepID=UPI0015D410C5|nr:hypothetical protein [Acinetobacter sp. YH16052]